MWMILLIAVVLILGIKVAIRGAKAEIKEKRRTHTHSTGATKESSSQSPAPVLIMVEQLGEAPRLEVEWETTFIEIERAVSLGDYDFARTWLQKFSYTTVDNNVPQWVRERFKTLMTAFAKQDPLYLTLIAKIRPIVEKQPGIMQTAIYSQLPEFSEEQIRYALYFAHELGDVNRLKKGRSYQVFGPVNQTVISPGEKIGNTIATSDIVITKNPIDERIASLHREATQHKKTDWDAAVACLQEATDLMRRHNAVSGIERWLRLPVFLQQAGRFAESLEEFDRLLKETEGRVKRESREDSSQTWIEYRIYLDLTQLYDKMRMAYKREKLNDKSAQYAALSAEHAERAAESWTVLELERVQARQAYEAKYEAHKAQRG